MARNENKTIFGIPKEQLPNYIDAGLLFLMIMTLWLVFGLWDWLNAKDFLTSGDIEIKRMTVGASRNRGFFILAIIGIVLTVWGRIIANKNNQLEKEQIELTRKSNVNDRYEKAARMLAGEIMSERIAGCQALRSLAEDDKKMWRPCTRLLFAYIKDPYLSKEEQKKLNGKNLIELFPRHEQLRTDIQEAINNVSDIYQHAYDKENKLDDEIIQLPSYFWQNMHKGYVCLAGGDLTNQDMKKAYLPSVDLREANLSDARLNKATFTMHIMGQGDIFKQYNAVLKKAFLDGANLTDTNLRNIKKLTKKQILSAGWKINKGEGSPPILPEKLMKDEEIQKWCEIPSIEDKDGEILLTNRDTGEITHIKMGRDYEKVED